MSHRPSLMLTRALPPQSGHRAADIFTILRWDRNPDTLLATVQHADAILCTPADRFDAALITRLPPRVKVIGTFSVGYEHIDLAAAAHRHIAVVHTPGVLSAATAEFTMLLLLAAARHAGQGERLVRSGQWTGFPAAVPLGAQLTGKQLGIFGMGRIGQALATMAQGFGMRVHYRNRQELPDRQDVHYHGNDEDFLRASAFLAMCAPATAQTRHWLNAARIAQLPQGAIIVNTSRGSLIDDAALIAALQTRHVASAGLDVFPDEPQVPAGYLNLENVVLTPHIASATVETREAMGHLVLDGIEAVLGGHRPPNQL